MVPVNASVELTNLPLSLYTSPEDFDALTQPPTFTSNCVICDESFSTQEESDAHFSSEDHETAQVTSTPFDQKVKCFYCLDSKMTVFSLFISVFLAPAINAPFGWSDSSRK